MRVTKSRLKEIILEEVHGIEAEEQLQESYPLSEGMLASIAPKVVEFIIENPKIMEILSKALAPMLAKVLGGEEEGGADLAGSVTEE
jgi:hypothetical protein